MPVKLVAHGAGNLSTDIASARGAGFDLVELDVRRADGVLVCQRASAPPNAAKTPAVRGVLRTSTPLLVVDALSEIEAAGLGAVLDLKQGPAYDPELPAAVATAVRPYLRRIEPIRVISYDHVSIRHLHAIDPEITTGAMFVARLVDVGVTVRAAGASLAVSELRFITTSVIQQARTAGLEIMGAVTAATRQADLSPDIVEALDFISLDLSAGAPLLPFLRQLRSAA